MLAALHALLNNTVIAQAILGGQSTNHPMSFRGEHLINMLSYGVDLLTTQAGIGFPDSSGQ